MTSIPPAPDSLIDTNGKPCFGQFNGIPTTLGLDLFIYNNGMDKKAGPLAKHFHYKQFQFVSLFTEKYIIGVAIADIRYATNAFCYVYETETKQLVENKWLKPLSIGSSMTNSPQNGTSKLAKGEICFEIVDGLWRLVLNTQEIQANLQLCPPEKSLPLSMCTPTGYSGWTYTQKHNALSLQGQLKVRKKEVKLEGAFGNYDFSAGYMRRETSWRWASTSTKLNGLDIGLNLAAGVNETGGCENALWVSGKRHLLPPVHFDFDREDKKKPWHIYSQDGQVDLVFNAMNQRFERLNFWLLKSNFRQFIGCYEGTVSDNAGNSHMLEQAIGLAEDHFARW